MKSTSCKPLILFFILSFILAACATSTPSKPTPKPFSGYWRVTKSTGLYDEPDADAAMIAELPVGKKVEDIDGNNYLSKSIVTEGMTVCHVVVQSTGQEGWVLKKWLE